MADTIRVILVDPSDALRGRLAEALAGEEDIRVASAFRNQAEAYQALESMRPDVVVLDVEMRDGITLLMNIQDYNAEHPERQDIGVILIARRDIRDADMTIIALESGAFDFVVKPEDASGTSVVDSLARQLRVKLRHYSSQRLISNMSSPPPRHKEPIRAAKPVPTPVPAKGAGAIRAVCIGVSTGGPKVLASILPELCRRVDLPVLIVQHMPPNFTSSLASSLDDKCGHTVKEAQDRETVEPRTIYIAPGGRHMKLARNSTGRAIIRVTDEAPEHGCRPSVNVLFRSAAQVFGSRTLAVVLTGMGTDGAGALGELKSTGAYIIAQDRSSSVIWGMPGSAVATGLVDKVLPASGIPVEIEHVAKGGQP